MAKKKVNRQKLIRLIAIVLAALLAGGAIISAVISFAYADESAPVQNHYAFEIEYLENEQALRISQRLAYTNETNGHLDRVIFYAPANLMRRQSALSYNDAAADCYPYEYAPGGIDLTEVRVNGEKNDYGFQGENEMYLRVACDIPAGESRAIAHSALLAWYSPPSTVRMRMVSCVPSRFMTHARTSGG